MSHVSLTEFRANMAKHLDKLEEDRTHLVITRQNHEPMVIMPLRDLEGIEETLHLLGNPANAQLLLQSIQQLDAGDVVPVAVDDPQSRS